MAKNKVLDTLFGTDDVMSVLPGTILALGVMGVSWLSAGILGDFCKTTLNLSSSPVSTFLLAIILGMLVRNLISLSKSFDTGIKFCVAKLLRLGIILLGIRLSIIAVAKIGIVAVMVVVICIAAGLILSSIFAKMFGVSNRLGTLIAAGTSICGVSAIVATAPAIGAKDEETTYAISTITIFGLIATITYPYLVQLVLKLNVAQAGVFLGTAVHDTAQVTGAAYIYDNLWNAEASKIAITTKLVRNVFLMAVVPICALMYAKQRISEGVTETKKTNLRDLFPTFVLGFIALAILRSIGDILVNRSGSFLIWSTPESWKGFIDITKDTAEYVLATAIAGAGLSTQFSKLKQLSYKPFLIGLMVALSVGLVSFVLVTILSGPISSLIVQ